MAKDGDKIEATFARAGRALKLCLIMEGPGCGRIVEPHAIFTSSRGKRLLHCYQVGGYTGGGERAGWKNIDLSKVTAARVLQAPFQPRGDYVPPEPTSKPTAAAAGARKALSHEAARRMLGLSSYGRAELPSPASRPASPQAPRLRLTTDGDANEKRP